MSNIQVEIHFFTAGSGGSGKTTALLNTLSYFVEKRDSNTSILIFDEGDNTDFSSVWVPDLRIQELGDRSFGHDHIQLNMYDTSPVIAFEPQPKSFKGFRWSNLNKIISSYVRILDLRNKHKIIVLVDTGGAPGTIIRNAGPITSLSKKIQWKIYPWILWTPNSLVNGNFIETTKLSLDELYSKFFEHFGNKTIVIPIHCFNPILPDLSGSTEFNFQRLSEFILPTRNRLAVIESFLVYQRRKALKDIGWDEFCGLAKFAFVETQSLNLALPPLETYKVIGKALNFRFIDKSHIENLEHFGYKNIFCIGVYDRDLASVKHSPGVLKKLLTELRKDSFDNNVAPVEYLQKILGEVYLSYRNNFEKFHSDTR